LAKYRQLRGTRYNQLRIEHFTPLESREFSKLPKNTPALKLMREARATRRDRFEKIAATKIANGKWRRADVSKKWIANLTRFYSKMKWRVKDGPVGAQQKMPKRGINPWAMYRAALREAPDKPDYSSPWKSNLRRQSRGIDPTAIDELRTRQHNRRGR